MAILRPNDYFSHNIGLPIAIVSLLIPLRTVPRARWPTVISRFRVRFILGK